MKFIIILSKLNLVGVLLGVACKINGAVGTTTSTKDYCLTTYSEQFLARCLKNEVIIMMHAKYGRMRMSHCLKDEERDIVEAFGHDPRFLGCSVDVLKLFDKKCSGKNECEVRGMDEELQRMKPCLSALKSYLEASFNCGIVVDGDRSCQVKVTPTTQYILPTANLSNAKNNCGNILHPWKLEAPVGQQISLNLLQFGESIDSFNCRSSGYIIDNSAKSNTTLCTTSGERVASILISQSNVLELVLPDHQLNSARGSVAYLVQIAAIGCSNVIPPADAWLRRDGNTAVVGCYTSRQSWTLRCVDNQWIGVIGNCTLDSTVLISNAESAEVVAEKSIHGMEVLVIATIIVGGLAICIGIVCVGAVCWKRYNNQYKKYSSDQNNWKNPNLKNGCLLNSQPLVSTS